MLSIGFSLLGLITLVAWTDEGWPRGGRRERMSGAEPSDRPSWTDLHGFEAKRRNGAVGRYEAGAPGLTTRNKDATNGAKVFQSSRSGVRERLTERVERERETKGERESGERFCRHTESRPNRPNRGGFLYPRRTHLKSFLRFLVFIVKGITTNGAT